jgi:3-phytase
MNFQLHSLISLAALALAGGCATAPRTSQLPAGARLITITPAHESAPSRMLEADADDVAFWRHPSDESRNLVFGTQKLGGFSVYDTEARTLLDALPGDVRYNNVDVIQGFPWQDGVIDIAVFSDRVGDDLHVYRITPEAPYLQRLPAADASFRVFGGQPAEDTAYGLALWRDARDGTTHAFVTQNDTRTVRQFTVREVGGQVAFNLVREFRFRIGAPTAHAEGLVVDPLTRRLYLAQEDVGIYKVDLDNLGTAPVVELGERELWQTVALPYLTADIEGLALLPTGPDSGYLVASSQGSNTFAVYERRSLTLVGVVSVVGSATIDGSEECDGLDITPHPWGPSFPHGVMIVHDGRDTPTGKTNYKWVDVGELLKKLNP